MPKGRAKYNNPVTKLYKAQETMKLISLGRDNLGIKIRRDIKEALGLEKNQLIWVTLEKSPPNVCERCNNSL